MVQKSDWRNIRNGKVIPTATYCDQPYITRTDDGAWLCVVTTGAGLEGEKGQHVVSLRSTDFGESWTDITPVEPPDGPEASYAVTLKVPQGFPNAGRIYCFYDHNTDRVPWVKADNPPFQDGKCYRVDSLGHFVFKYSDDHGRSWSKQRYDIQQRMMDIDRQNAYQGELKFFWNVGKPFIHQGAAYVPLHKVGGFGAGFFTRSEGVLLTSASLLTEDNPAHATWETLPDGEFGLSTPPGGGSIAEEQSFVVLSDGSLFVVYRSIDGYPVCTYSRDHGHTWETPRYQRYADGRLMKHPRAANFVWKCSNGKYLYWFHNHGGDFIKNHPERRTMAYNDRNPVWLCGGIEIDGPNGKEISWSQPEVLLYDDDPYIRISYPDLVEDHGRYFITETQKDSARVHEIDAWLLDTLWSQRELNHVTQSGCVLAYHKALSAESTLPLSKLPTFNQRSDRADHGIEHTREGFSIEVVCDLSTHQVGTPLISNTLANGQGFSLTYTLQQTLEIMLNDGRTANRWHCDPALLLHGKPNHVVITVDGGPHIINFIINGKLDDGGTYRQFGWGRFSPYLIGIDGDDTLRITPDITLVRIYNRNLLTSEAISNYQAYIGK